MAPIDDRSITPAKLRIDVHPLRPSQSTVSILNSTGFVVDFQVYGRNDVAQLIPAKDWTLEPQKVKTLPSGEYRYRYRRNGETETEWSSAPGTFDTNVVVFAAEDLVKLRSGYPAVFENRSAKSVTVCAIARRVEVDACWRIPSDKSREWIFAPKRFELSAAVEGAGDEATTRKPDVPGGSRVTVEDRS